MSRISRAFLRIILIFILLLAFELTVSIRSLSWDFYWDDIHLIRTYSTSELRGVFNGQWDPDGIERPGYRPLTTIFFYFSAIAFGENPIYHRVFQQILLALSLTIFTIILNKYFKVEYLGSVIGCIVAISSRYNWFNLAWIADSHHHVVILFFILSLWVFLSTINKWSPLKLLLSIGLAGLAQFAKEDAIALFLLMPIFGFYYILQSYQGESFVSVHDLKRKVCNIIKHNTVPFVNTGILTASLAALSTLYFVLRHHFVPEAAINFNLYGWLANIYWSLYPLGKPVGLRYDNWLPVIWTIVLGALFVITLTLFLRKQYQALFWLVCLVITASPGLTVPRIDLIFFPILFFSQFLVLVLLELGKKNQLAKAMVLIFLCVLVFRSSQLSMISQETMHPLSLERLRTTGDIVSAKATIPQERLARITAEVAKFGIKTKEDYQTLLPLLEAQARKEDLRKPNLPNAYKGLFLPPILFHDT